MANYLAAWKTFRRVGNEPEATAEHILGRQRWPKKSQLSVLDVGCGDGRMLEAFILRAKPPLAKVVLLDPDQHLLNEAKLEIEALGTNCNVATVRGAAETKGVKWARKTDAGLAIHVAYLMPHSAFFSFVENWPARVPLYVVLDAPTSVFSELWTKTAPEYSARAARVHSYLGKEAKTRLNVRSSEFATRVANPHALSENVRDLVLSLLCYTEYTRLSPAVRGHVKRTLMKHADGDEINCKCSCYEILKS
jgi:SAM-dependent methyltransferase